MAHGLFCKCKKCNPSLLDSLFGSTSKSSNNFSKKQRNGTTIYGPKGEDKRPGHKHGHYGKDFHRTPHSTIGSAAIGKPHTYYKKDGVHGGHKTRRWD